MSCFKVMLLRIPTLSASIANAMSAIPKSGKRKVRRIGLLHSDENMTRCSVPLFFCAHNPMSKMIRRNKAEFDLPGKPNL